jgi:5-methylcytosine-specific restriction endonuclease McrA
MARRGEKQTEAWLAVMRGRKNTPETIEKMRQNRKGKGSRPGASNHFYGKTHTPEALEKNRQAHLGKSTGNQYAKGYRHTPDACARIAAAMKATWEQRRADPTLAPNIPMHPERAEGITGQIPRSRWNPSQQRNWKADCCAWCGATDLLELDHIIPRFMGGTNTRDNCQTLCQPCNNWKLNHIDKPQYKALQAVQGAKHSD